MNRYEVNEGLDTRTVLGGSSKDRRLLKFKKVKVSFYIAQYPVLRTIQSALHFTSLTDLCTQIPSRLLWEASSHTLQLIREGRSYTYPPV